MVSKPGSARLEAPPLPRCAVVGGRVLASAGLAEGTRSALAPSTGASPEPALLPACATETPGARAMAPASAPAKRWNGMLESRARRAGRLQFQANRAPRTAAALARLSAELVELFE